MTRRVERLLLPRGGGVVSGSFVEVLRASVADDDDWLRVDCEVDDALPPFAREFMVVHPGMAVPGRQRPRTVEFETFAGVETIETGEVDTLTAVYACPVDGAGDIYLYWLVAAPV